MSSLIELYYVNIFEQRIKVYHTSALTTLTYIHEILTTVINKLHEDNTPDYVPTHNVALIEHFSGTNTTLVIFVTFQFHLVEMDKIIEHIKTSEKKEN